MPLVDVKKFWDSLISGSSVANAHIDPHRRAWNWTEITKALIDATVESEQEKKENKNEFKK